MLYEKANLLHFFSGDSWLGHKLKLEGIVLASFFRYSWQEQDKFRQHDSLKTFFFLLASLKGIETDVSSSSSFSQMPERPVLGKTEAGANNWIWLSHEDGREPSTSAIITWVFPGFALVEVVSRIRIQMEALTPAALNIVPCKPQQTAFTPHKIHLSFTFHFGVLIHFNERNLVLIKRNATKIQVDIFEKLKNSKQS